MRCKASLAFPPEVSSPPEESPWPGGWGTRSWEAGGQGRPHTALCPPPTGPCLWPPVEALQDAPERADEFRSPETKPSLLLSISTCRAVREHCLRLLLQRALPSVLPATKPGCAEHPPVNQEENPGSAKAWSLVFQIVQLNLMDTQIAGCKSLTPNLGKSLGCNCCVSKWKYKAISNILIL